MHLVGCSDRLVTVNIICHSRNVYGKLNEIELLADCGACLKESSDFIEFLIELCTRVVTTWCTCLK